MSRRKRKRARPPEVLDALIARWQDRVVKASRKLGELLDERKRAKKPLREPRPPQPSTPGTAPPLEPYKFSGPDTKPIPPPVAPDSWGTTVKRKNDDLDRAFGLRSPEW